MLLGVNIDHIAYLRETRKINDPNPIDALGVLKKTAVNQVTIHLREDRRHINDDDLFNIVKLASMPVNLECSLSDEMIEIAIKAKPSRVTIVPEKREEITTEGGLDVKKNFDKLQKTCDKLTNHDIDISLFIDPEIEIIELSSKLKQVKWVELHTGKYSNIYAMLNSSLRYTKNSIKELELPNSKLKILLEKSIKEIINATNEANNLGFLVAAGHGLNYFNVKTITEIKGIKELNIGQSIIARSIFSGLEHAIIEMQRLVK